MCHKLTDTQIRSVTKPGRFSDGDGLYLSVSKTGSKSWVFMWKRQGKRREIGLGSFQNGIAPVSLALAREKAHEIRSILARGGDPFLEMRERQIANTTPNFGTIADEYIATMEKEWKNDKHCSQWQMTLSEYAKPIRNIPVSDITVDDVVRCLKPIWSEKPETASRTRGRIEKVLDSAKARGLRTGENPATWKGNIELILLKVAKLKRGHHSAMPYEELPSFIPQLRQFDGTGARALEFTILTAGRTGEVINAIWPEIDVNARVWMIPAERMKMSREHRVPLCGAAIAILEALPKHETSNYIFPGRKTRNPMSNMTMTGVLRKLGTGEYTVHGFRSSFRDWAGDETTFPREILEHALAHEVGDDTEQSYRRKDALERRRVLMETWQAFLDGKKVM